jgi:glycosyltransferase involved in cell wall biosynthesis
MKIALMLRNLGQKGGINVYTINVVSNLLRLDQKNEYLILYQDKAQLGAFSQYENAKEVVLRAPNKLLWDQVVVPRFLSKEGVDLVFNPKHTVPIFGGCKKTMVIHGAEQLEITSAFPFVNRIYTALTMPFYARRSNIVITTTQTGVDDLSRHLKMPESKFRFFYEGAHERFKRIEDEDSLPVCNALGLPEKFILFVGGLTPIKNFGRIVEAYSTLIQKHDYALVVVGFNRFKFEREVATASELVKDNKIIFTGFVPDEDLPALYSQAELLIFPSLYEGFGLPALEAMSCGCPVVTSTKGCTKEVTGDAAVLVDPYDPSDICDGMLRVIEDPELRANMVKLGLNRSSEFSWEKAAQELLALFDEMEAS